MQPPEKRRFSTGGSGGTNECDRGDACYVDAQREYATRKDRGGDTLAEFAQKFGVMRERRIGFVGRPKKERR